MVTVLTGVEISSEASKVIKSWVKEVNLHGTNGKLVTLRKACEIIIEDFAETLSKDENLLAEELVLREQAYSELVHQ